MLWNQIYDNCWVLCRAPRAPIDEEMMVYTALVNISQQTNTLRGRGSPLIPNQFIKMGVTHDTWGNTTATEVTAK